VSLAAAGELSQAEPGTPAGRSLRPLTRALRGVSVELCVARYAPVRAP